MPVSLQDPLSNSLDTQENFEGQAAQTEAQCPRADAEQVTRAHMGHVLRASGCLVKMNPRPQVQLTLQTVTLSPSEGGT